MAVATDMLCASSAKQRHRLLHLRVEHGREGKIIRPVVRKWHKVLMAGGTTETRQPRDRATTTGDDDREFQSRSPRANITRYKCSSLSTTVTQQLRRHPAYLVQTATPLQVFSLT
jgi:hypothetical protein